MLAKRFFKSQNLTRAFCNKKVQAKGIDKDGRRKVVLFPGHGIGPEITDGVLKIFNELKIPIDWEYHEVSGTVLNKDGDLISEHTLNRIRELGYALKGPFTTPIGKVSSILLISLGIQKYQRHPQKEARPICQCKTLQNNQRRQGPHIPGC